LTPGEIEKVRRDFIASRAPRPKPPTVNRYLAALKTALSFAVLNGKIEKNPVGDVKMERENNERVRFLTQEEERRLLAAISLHSNLSISDFLRPLEEDL
jgi:site-specific recombinase XerD